MSKTFDNFQFPQGGWQFDDCNAPGAPQTPLGDPGEYGEQALPWETSDDDAFEPGDLGSYPRPDVKHTGTPPPFVIGG